jgi:hypothetical protein
MTRGYRTGETGSVIIKDTHRYGNVSSDYASPTRNAMKINKLGGKDPHIKKK